MRQDLLVGYIFFSLCAIISLVDILRPDLTISLTKKYFHWIFKLHGFEGEIKTTQKARIRCRIAGMIGLCFFLFLLTILPQLSKR